MTGSRAHGTANKNRRRRRTEHSHIDDSSQAYYRHYGMPFALLRACCQMLNAGVFALLDLPYRILSRLGVRAHEDGPLFVYSKYPFNMLYTDQFDRFSAPVKKRYDPNEVKQLLENVGLVNVAVRSCFGWVADGTKPG